MLSAKQYWVLNLTQISTPSGAQSAMFAICVLTIGLRGALPLSVAKAQTGFSSMTYNLLCDPARGRIPGQQNANCRTTCKLEAQYCYVGHQRIVRCLTSYCQVRR